MTNSFIRKSWNETLASLRSILDIHRSVYLRYTLLLPHEITRYLGCPVISSEAVFGAFAVGSPTLPLPLSKLATREELTTWLSRVFFQTIIPAQSKARPYQIGLTHNLVAFFDLLLYLHRVGYPGHWLSEFLAKILSGNMISDVVPYSGFLPIPVNERSRRFSPRRVRTDPWLVEFETIITIAYYGIPFPIHRIIPHGAEDIVEWQVDVQPYRYYSMANSNNLLSPVDPQTKLLFWRGDAAMAASLIPSMPRIFEGQTEPRPGTFFVLTAQEHVDYEVSIRFKLSLSRVQRMRRDGMWYMCAYRDDAKVQGTSSVTG